MNSLPGSGVNYLFIDEEGIIFISTNLGFCSYDISTEEFTRYMSVDDKADEKVSYFITSTCQDYEDKNVLWLGSYYGLIKLNKVTKSKQLFEVESENLVASNHITTVYDDKRGNICLGTSGAGLFYLDKASEKVYSARKNKNTSILTIYETEAREVIVGLNNEGVKKLD